MSLGLKNLQDFNIYRNLNPHTSILVISNYSQKSIIVLQPSPDNSVNPLWPGFGRGDCNG